MIKEEAQYDESNIPNECFCPITQEIMEDPVIANDGHTYERTAIESWFKLGKRISPKTGVRLLTTELTPNHTMRSLIGDIKASVPILARHKLVIENIEAAVKLREEEIQLMLQEKGELLNQEKQKSQSLQQTLEEEVEGLRRENKLLRDELQNLKQENEQKIEMLNKKAESDMHKLKEQLDKVHLNEIEEVKQTIKKEVLNLNTLLNRLENTVPKPQQSINPAQTGLTIFHSPKPVARKQLKPATKKQLNSAEQKRQNQFIEAILNADLEKVKLLHKAGALLMEPNNHKMYPLIAAVYSLDMETLKYIEGQLGREADSYWAKVDLKEAQRRIVEQIPERRPKGATLDWLGNWYKGHSKKQWCEWYDRECLERTFCDVWNEDDWGERLKNAIEFDCFTNEVYENWQNDKTTEGDINSENYLILPNRHTHDKIVSEITEQLDQFNQYVQSKVAQYNSGAKLK